MVKQIYLFDSPSDPNDSERDHYFRNLDYKCQYIKHCLGELEKTKGADIHDIYTSPYLSSLQLAIEMSKKSNISFKIDNALYDVLDKKNYELFKCNYYWPDQERNLLRGKNSKRILIDILNHRESFYESSILASNIKYGEEDTDISNRIGSFIFKAMGSSEDKSNVALICHKALFPYIIEYVSFYNSTNPQKEKIQVILR
tara:strand:- start:667 stop:1266 length:600 start_codon:yes stop_codon:yes gene_type:complete